MIAHIKKWQTVLNCFVLTAILLTLGPTPQLQAASIAWTEIAAGLEHSMAVNARNELWVWGRNSYHQLGIGDDQLSSEPVKLLDDIVAVAAGSFHSLALAKDGTLFAWGWNSNGQIGDGSRVNVLEPKVIMRDVSSIAAGHEFSAAINRKGELYCWGNNDYGQLGLDNNRQIVNAPRIVLTGVSRISAGTYHLMILNTRGTLLTTGMNQYSQTGHGVGEDTMTPKALLENVSAISAGGWHSLALLRDGSVLSWGRNLFGQLGTEDRTDRYEPTKVRESGVTAICGGETISAIIDSEGFLYTWGSAETAVIGRDYDAAQPLLQRISQVSIGGSHALALQSDGVLWAWGSNEYGQLGLSSSSHRGTPQRVLYDIVEVAAGADHVLVRSGNDSLYVWGKGSSGQLGNGGIRSSATPLYLLDKVSSIGSGAQHSLAFTQQGQLYIWGSNDYGQLGNGSNVERLQMTPLPIPGEAQNPVEDSIARNVYVEDMSSAVSSALYREVEVIGQGKIAQLTGGRNHTLLLKENGDLWAWGDNSYGQLGLGAEAAQVVNLPQKVMENVRAIAAGDHFSMAITLDHSLWVWGENSSGQLGIGHKQNRSQPVKILDGVLAAAGGRAHMLVIMDDSSLWVAGDNALGQLGLGIATKESLIPTKLSSQSGIIAIAAGNDHSLAVNIAGKCFGWGANDAQQLGGDGSSGANAAYPVPTLVMEEVQNVAAGDQASYLLCRDATLWTLGSKIHGQLGDEQLTGEYYTPQRVKLSPQGNQHNLILQVDRSRMWAMGELVEVDPGRDTTPRLIDSMTMLPIRAVIEAFGGSVAYVAENGSTLLELDGHSLQITAGSSHALLDGVPITITAPLVRNERTLVHIRVVEHLGLKLVWDSQEESVTLSR